MNYATPACKNPETRITRVLGDLRLRGKVDRPCAHHR